MKKIFDYFYNSKRYNCLHNLHLIQVIKFTYKLSILQTSNMPSSDQFAKCSAAILAMLDTGVLNMPSGQPLCQANKDLVVKNMSDILADHFSVETEKNLEIPEKKSRGRPAGTSNSTPSVADLRSSLKELGLSTSGKKAELSARHAKAVPHLSVPKSSKKTKKDKDKKDKNDKKKVEEPKKRGRKKGAKNKHPSKTKKNTAAAIVIQARVRTLLAKNAYLAAQKKAALVSKKKTKKPACKSSMKKKPTKKKTNSSQ